MAFLLKRVYRWWFLSQATAAEFPNPKMKEVITVDADASIALCLRVLAQNNILSAPVKDPETGYASD